MKLAFSTLGSPAWSFEEQLTHAKEMGFQGIEVRGIQEHINIRDIPAFKPQQIEHTKNLLKQTGVKLICLSTSIMAHRTDLEAEYLEELEATLQIADALNVPYIRIFGDSIAPAFSVSCPIIAGQIRKFCHMAEGTPTKLLLETHGEISTPEHVLKLIDAIHSDAFGLLWDPGHTDEFCLDAPELFYNVTKDFIYHVHIRDHHRNTPHGFCRTGEGDLPIPKIVKLLEEEHYSGFYTFEWEKRWRPDSEDPETIYPHYVDYMNKLDSQLH